MPSPFTCFRRFYNTFLSLCKSLKNTQKPSSLCIFMIDIWVLQGIFARYGAPVVVLSLLKTVEKRPRECLLGQEFGKAVQHINNKVQPEASKFSAKRLGQLIMPYPRAFLMVESIIVVSALLPGMCSHAKLLLASKNLQEQRQALQQKRTGLLPFSMVL